MRPNGQNILLSAILERKNFDVFLKVLTERGYNVIGPTVQDETIVFATIKDSSDLPIGWSEEQEGGYYHLIKNNTDTLFGFSSTAQSLKRFLFPSEDRLWSGELKGSKFKVTNNHSNNNKFAFVGVRGCDLQAINILDKVLTSGKYSDEMYKKRRSNLFIVAVNCTYAGDTCFCTSMGTGPKVKSGFDIALTEVIEKNHHYFVAEVATKLGLEILESVPHSIAKENEIEIANEGVLKASRAIRRKVDTDGIKEILYKNAENNHWHDIAKRCLTCGNCTMVCPTCFCSTIEDTTNIIGSEAMRLRKWDSCFTLEFSYIHGGSIRNTVYSRYRQWLTHKFAAWQDQFQIFGCVGCGRCITWCPVGIDITEELKTIRELSDKQPSTFLKENK